MGGGSEAGDQMDIQQYLDMYQPENNADTMDMYRTQVDGDPGDEEVDEPEPAAEPSMPTVTEAEEVPAVTAGAGAVADHLSLAINQSIPEAASTPVTTETQGEPIKQEEKPVVADLLRCYWQQRHCLTNWPQLRFAESGDVRKVIFALLEFITAYAGGGAGPPVGFAFHST